MKQNRFNKHGIQRNNSTNQGKRNLTSLLAVVGDFLLGLFFSAILASTQGFANPEGGQVTAGSASINHTSPGRLDIVQSSEKAVIDWRGFSIRSGEHTHFQQPGVSSMALNRVTGNQSSAINGNLTANGRVFLINPNGVLFGKNSKVNVGSLITTTSDIDNDNFMAGRLVFDKDSNELDAAVINRGQIEVTEDGTVVLAAPSVANEGLINARLGQVVLAGIERYTIDFNGDGLFQFDLGEKSQNDSSTYQSNKIPVSNSGTIMADGGIVQMTANVADTVVDHVINMEGVVRARAVGVQGGSIILSGGKNGIVAVSGTLDASGVEVGQIGGEVKVLGEKIGLFDGAEIDASGDAGGGKVLVGGNFQGKGPEGNAKKTYVAEKAVINASAVNDGDGGKVIVWSDQVTSHNGTITAKGGENGGDGGFVEVSGKRKLDFKGNVSVSSEQGKSGNVLLDPEDIFIELDDQDFDPNELIDKIIVFNDGDIGDGLFQDFTIGNNTLENIDGNIVLQAQQDITVNSRLNLANQTDGERVVFQAGRGITINEPIETQGADLHFESDSPHSTVGAADEFGPLTISAPISSNGGDITLIHSEALTIRSPVSAGDGDVNTALSINNSSPIVKNLGFFDHVNTTGAVVIGHAKTAGIDGLGNGIVDLSYNTLDLEIPIELSAQFAGELQFITNNGFTLNQPLTLNQPIIINGDVDGDSTGAVNVNAPIFTNGEDLSISSGDKINISADITTFGGNINLNTGLNNPGWIRLSGNPSSSIPIAIEINTDGGNFLAIGEGVLVIEGFPPGQQQSDGIFISNTHINAGGGNINLIGSGGSIEEGEGNGIRIDRRSIVESFGAGTITLEGSGGSIGNLGIIGVLARDTGTTLRTENGVIEIIGNAGTASGSQNNDGVSIFNGAIVEATGTGDISINGTGGDGIDNQGVAVGSSNDSNSVVQSAGGNINLEGTGTGTGGELSDFGNHGVFIFDNASIGALGNGSMTLKGEGGSNGAGVFSSNVFQSQNPIRISTASDTSTITLRTENAHLNAPTEVSGSGVLKLEQLDPSQDFTVELSNSIQDGFSEIFVGHESGTGTLTVDDSEIFFHDNITLRSPNPGGNIVVNGPIQTNGNDLTLNAGSTISFSADIDTGGQNGGSIVINSGGAIESSGSAIILGRDINITANGPITLNGINSSRHSILGHSITINTPDSLVLNGFLNMRVDDSANAGNVTIGNLLIPKAITLGGISTRNLGGGNGGHINISTTGPFTATDFFSRESGDPASGFNPLSNPDFASITTEATANGGNVNIVANGGVSTAVGIFSNSAATGNGGALTLTSTNGIISTGIIDSSSATGNGGDLNITASNNYVLTNINTSSGGAGNGGALTLTSTNGTINSGILNTRSVSGNSGDLTITAASDLTLDNIDTRSSGTGNGGNVSVSSTGGGLTVNQEILSGNGDVTITALNEVDITADITTSGGTIDITSEVAGIDAIGSTLRSLSPTGPGGDISFNAATDIITGGQIITYGTSTGGNINVTSTNGNIEVGNTLVAGALVKDGEGRDLFTTDTGGEIVLSAAGNISAGEIFSAGGFQDGAISINSGKAINITGSLGVPSNPSGGIGGAIALTAEDDITTADITSSGDLGGGSIVLTSNMGAIFSGDFNSSSVAGNGGDLSINSSSDLVLSSIDTSSGDAGNGGNVSLLSAGGSLTVNKNIFSGDGNLAITALDQVDINADITTTGGAIDITSEAGGINTIGSTLRSLSLNGPGGNITFNAAGDIITEGQIIAYGSSTGGNIHFTSSNGAIDVGNTLVGGALVTDGNGEELFTTGTGGQIVITAADNITTSEIFSVGEDQDGAISINSGRAINVNGTLGVTSNPADGRGGAVELTAEGNITTTDISSSGDLGGASIALTSNSGTISSGALNSSSMAGNGGDISINASSDLVLSGVDTRSESAGKGGNITVSTTNGGLTVNGNMLSGNGDVVLSANETLPSTIANLTLAADIKANTTMLSAADSVLQTDGSIQTTELAVDAFVATLLGPNSVDTLAVNLTGSGESFSYTDTNDLLIGSVGPLTGISLNNGGLNLTSANGNLVIEQDLSGIEDLTLSAVTITANDISSSGFQNYDGDLQLAGTFSTNGGGFNVTGNSTLTTDTSIDTSDGDVQFDGQVIGNNDLKINTKGGEITFNGEVNGLNTLTLSAGNSGDILFNGDVGSVTPLGLIDILSANDLTVLGRIFADQMDVVYQGDFSTVPTGFLNVGSLILSPDAQSARLEGVVNESEGIDAALQVQGPVGNKEFTINECTIGVSCKSIPSPAEPTTDSAVAAKEIIDGIVSPEGTSMKPPSVVSVALRSPPSDDPTQYQFSNLGNEELWDNNPGGFSISSFAAFTVSSSEEEKKKDEKETDEE